MHVTIFGYLENVLSCFIKLSNNDTKDRQLTGLNTTIFILNNNQKPDLTNLKAKQNKKKEKKAKKHKNKKKTFI